MPTGYTADVVDGKVTEFRDFALCCARAFSALIMMRDEPSSTPIPAEIAPDTSYYDGRIVEAEAALAILDSMTEAQASAAAQAAHEKAVAYRTKYLAGKGAAVARINSMLEKVRAWKNPHDHERMKSFMIDQ